MVKVAEFWIFDSMFFQEVFENLNSCSQPLSLVDRAVNAERQWRLPPFHSKGNEFPMTGEYRICHYTVLLPRMMEKMAK